MKIRSATQSIEDLLPELPQSKLEIENASAEVHRVVKRLKTLLVRHFESAARISVVLGPDDLRVVIDALMAEADRLRPDPHLQCPEELRHYLRVSMFDELVGEPSNILYSTQVSEETIRYEAMPANLWKSCLESLRKQLDSANETSK